MRQYTTVSRAEPNAYSTGQTSVGLFPYLVIAFIPFALLDIRLPVPGMQVRVSDFYLLLLFAAFVLKFKDAVPWVLRTTCMFLPFLVYLIISTAVSGNRGGIVDFVQWGFVLLWVPVLSYVLRDADEALIRVLLLSLMAVAVYVAIAHVVNGDLVRYKSLGDAKYTFGLFSLLTALWLLRFKQLRYWFVLLLALLLMGLSLERNGAVIFFATMLFIVPLMALKANSFYISSALLGAKVLVFGSGFIAYFFLFRDSVSVTHFLNEDLALWESNLHRANLISNGVEIFLEHPWFGVGGKMLDEVMREYYIDTSLALYTHNWYLDFFVEYGAVGVLLFLMAIVPAILGVSTHHRLAWVLIPLAFYCFAVPVFMANGTTTKLIYLTAVACCQASGWRATSAGGGPRRVR